MPTRFPIFIVDAPSILLHAYTHPATKTAVHPAVYTFCKMLIELEKKFHFAHIVIIWDERDIPKTTAQYSFDKNILMEYIDSMRMEQLSIKNLTTFDLVFSMIKSFGHQHHDVIIVTVDQEILSLIDEQAQAFNPFKKIIIDKKPKKTPAISLTEHRHPNPTTAARTQFSDKNWHLGFPFFEKYGYKKLLTQLQQQLKPVEQHALLQLLSATHQPKFKLFFITTLQQLIDICDAIQQSKFVCINVQGTDIDPMVSSCAAISIAFNEKDVHFIPLQLNQNQTSLSFAQITSHLKHAFANKRIEKVMHNAKFNQIILAQHNMPIAGKIFDVTIAASLVMHNDQENNLELLKDFYARNATLSYQAMTSDDKHADKPQLIEKELWNSITDTHQTIMLKNALARELEKEQMTSLFESIEMPINNVLVDMEMTGIFCDTNLLKKMADRITQDIEILEQEINSYSPTAINVNSTPQIRKLLFDILKLPIQQKLHRSEKLHKHRLISTDAQTLIELSKFHPIAELILDYRELFKFKHAYLTNLPQYIHKKTHKIHAFWEQSLGTTDRISCSHPNLQAIPTRDPGCGAFIRSAFAAQDNNIFIAADYNDIMLHVLAYLSQDQNLQHDLKQKENVHSKTACHIFATTENLVTPAQRSIAKKINTSIAYGLTAYGLAQDQHISIRLAEFAIKKFFEEYPTMQAWMHKTIEVAQKNLYVTTLFGKRRFIANLTSKNRVKLDAAKRIAINSIVQGSATEIMKIAMIVIHEKIADAKLQAHIILNLHDQLVLTVAESDLEQTKKIVQTAMSSALSSNHPLPVTILTGKNWQEVTIAE